MIVCKGSSVHSIVGGNHETLVRRSSCTEIVYKGHFQRQTSYMYCNHTSFKTFNTAEILYVPSKKIIGIVDLHVSTNMTVEVTTENKTVTFNTYTMSNSTMGSVKVCTTQTQATIALYISNTKRTSDKLSIDSTWL